MNRKCNDSDRWRDAVRYFENEMVDLGWDFTFFIKILERVAESAYADDLCPHPSRWGSLSFSLLDDFGGLEMPMVAIVRKRNGFGRIEYQVEYWNKPGYPHDLQKWRCHKSQVLPLLESLFLRMSIESGSRE